MIANEKYRNRFINGSILTILVQPMVEVANVMRQKIVLGSALSNACLAAKDRSLDMRNDECEMRKLIQKIFKDYFSEAFEAAMNVTRIPSSGNTMVFKSNNGNYNTFCITLDIATKVDTSTGNSITEINVKAETPYKYKTKYLQMAADASSLAIYNLKSERMLLLKVTS